MMVISKPITGSPRAVITFSHISNIAAIDSTCSGWKVREAPNLAERAGCTGTAANPISSLGFAVSGIHL